MVLQLHLPAVTIVKVLATLALVALGKELLPLVMLLLLATMLAVTVFPMFRWLQSRHLPSWIGMALVIGGLFSSVALLGLLVGPPLLEQTSTLLKGLPHLKETVLGLLPDNHLLRDAAQKAIGQIDIPDPASLLTPLVSVGQIAMGGVTQLIFILIFAVYLLADGPRAVTWLLAFFSEDRRRKMRQTADEVSKIVSAYVLAQVITSLICGVFTFVLLYLLKVPAATMLATLAALFDVLPVLGFFLAAIPAVALGFSVSPFTALLVTGGYICYHAVENYLLVPKIYGKNLRVSDLVVLVSLIAAGTLGGILGAIAILPLVASYPIIERIWLGNVVGNQALAEHANESKPTA